MKPVKKIDWRKPICDVYDGDALKARVKSGFNIVSVYSPLSDSYVLQIVDDYGRDACGVQLVRNVEEAES